MQIHVIEVATDVFRLLKQRAPWLVGSAEENSGPTQKVLLPDEIYVELIDRAIAHRQTLDQVLRVAFTAPASQSYTNLGNGPGKSVKQSN